MLEIASERLGFNFKAHVPRGQSATRREKGKAIFPWIFLTFLVSGRSENAARATPTVRQTETVRDAACFRITFTFTNEIWACHDCRFPVVLCSRRCRCISYIQAESVLNPPPAPPPPATPPQSLPALESPLLRPCRYLTVSRPRRPPYSPYAGRMWLSL